MKTNKYNDDYTIKAMLVDSDSTPEENRVFSQKPDGWSLVILVLLLLAGLVCWTIWSLR